MELAASAQSMAGWQPNTVPAREAPRESPSTGRSWAAGVYQVDSAIELIKLIKLGQGSGQEISTHITEMVGNFAAHLTRDEMAYGTQERGLNWGSIRAPDELVDEGHLNDRGFWVEVPHPELDRSFKYPGPAGIYNGSPWRISRRAPLIGEHNEEIYCGELGLQRTELAYLAESGVV